MKITPRFVLLFTLLPLVILAAGPSGDQEKSQPIAYARGTRAIESVILLQREEYVKGVQNLQISESLLAGFTPDYLEFYLDGVLMGIDSAAPWEAEIDAGPTTKKRSFLVIAVKESRLKARAAHAPAATGDAATPADAAAAADTDASGVKIADRFEIAITSPIEGNYVIGRTPISVEATFEDNARLESVQIYIDGQLVATVDQEPWEYVHNFGRSFNGRVIRVVAFDSLGRRAEAMVTTSPLEESAVFIETRVVTLEVTATDDRGKFIGGLTENDFEIFDNGQKQEIRYFSTEERPIWVAVLVDTSGSMQGGKIRRSVFAAQQFIGQLKANDHAMVMTFGPESSVISEFTRDFPKLIETVGRIDAIKNAMTPINQSLYDALASFKDRVGRRAIVIITDGADTASAITPDVVYEEAKRADVRIYTITISGIGVAGGNSFDDDMALSLMRGYADVTGGDSYFPQSASEFLGIFRTIAEELRSQYSIGYMQPKVSGNAWRTLEVKLKQGGIARTKQGYYPYED